MEYISATGVSTLGRPDRTEEVPLAASTRMVGLAHLSSYQLADTPTATFYIVGTTIIYIEAGGQAGVQTETRYSCWVYSPVVRAVSYSPLSCAQLMTAKSDRIFFRKDWEGPARWARARRVA